MALCVLLEIQRGDRPSDVCAGLLDGLADWLKAPPILVRGLQPVEIGELAFKRDLGLALGTAPVFLQLRDARRDDAEAAGRLAVDHDLPPEDFCSCRAPLLSMAANRPRGDFEALLALRADVNKPDSRGHTPLVYAVFAYSRGCTTLLLRAGASVAPDTGYCPLLLSVAMGQCQMVNRAAFAGYLRMVWRVNGMTEEIMRAFRMHGHHTAGPHPPILPVALSEAGAEHALILEQFHRMPSVGLLVAEEHSDRIAITYDSSASLPTYALALRRAFCRQDYDLAANILERRPFLIEEAEYIVWGDDGLPLVWAAKRREVGAISTLLQARASPNMTTPGHAAPLLLAARHGGIGSVALLLLARADVNHVDADGLSALSIGAALRSPPLVSLLLEFRAHLSTRPEVLLPLLNSTFQRDGLGHDHCETSVLLLRAAGGVGHSDVVHKVISELVPRLLAEGNWSAIFVVHCWAHLQLGLQSTVASGCCPASASGS
ncbi:unnamed protein product [Symbiodinium sp. CCMP2592]|nr:unnamed protein product [Symbiodinium sp. CCMP2592]